MDSISTILQDTFQQSVTQIRYDGIPIPSLPTTEHWVSWCLFILVALLLITWGIDSHTIQAGFDISLTNKERNSIFKKTTLKNLYAQIFFYTYQCGVYALTAYIFIHQPTEPFTLKSYLYCFLFVGLFFLFKDLMFRYLEFVFFNRQAAADIWRETYFNTVGALSILLFPILILYLYLPENIQIISIILLIIIILCAFSFLFIKLFQLFFRNILAFFYIMLYLCTLEILPVFGIISVLKIII